MLNAYRFYIFCSTSGCGLNRKWLDEGSTRRRYIIPYPLDSVFWQKYNPSLHRLLNSYNKNMDNLWQATLPYRIEKLLKGLCVFLKEKVQRVNI